MVTRWSGARRCTGFTYLEVLVALTIFASSLVSVAQLSAIAVRANLASRDTSYETRLATQKLAELQAESLASLPTTAVENWMRSAPGAFDFLDQRGQVLAVGGTPPASAVYVRRWSVLRLSGAVASAVAIQTSVERVRVDAGGAVRDAGRARVVRVVAVRSRLVP